MSSIGKKILSAFVEVKEDKQPPVTPSQVTRAVVPESSYALPVPEKFKQYFDKLFMEANIPGPDYYEFAKMTEAMQAIPDERARYLAAYAGLSVQGLDKEKLLQTAQEYIKVLEADAGNFHQSVDRTLEEKVHLRKKEAEENVKRIELLTREIAALQEAVTQLHEEIRESEARIEENTGGYMNACNNMRQTIEQDIEKIRRLIP